MATAQKEIYELELKLKANWADVLKKQTRQFENFIQKANDTTRTLEKSITGMQTNLSKSYEGMFSGSQSEIRKLVSFADHSLKTISTSTDRIMNKTATSQKHMSGLIERNLNLLKKYEQLRTKAKGKADQGIDPTANLKKVQSIDKLMNVLGTQTQKIAKKNDLVLTKMLARHFHLISEGVKNKSNAISKGTKRLIDDSITQWNRAKNQTRFMDDVPAIAHKAKGIGGMEDSQKQVHANLKELREAHKTAQGALRKQTQLRVKAEREEI